ncbi:hypothetical protein MGH68_16945 [Erysipelothrix sp. D19-032]
MPYRHKQQPTTMPMLPPALDELGYTYTVDGNDLTVEGMAIHAKDAHKGKNAIVYLVEGLHKSGKTNDMIRFIVEKMSNPNGTLVFGEVEDEVSENSC